MKLLMRTLLGMVYGPICFLGGCWITANIFHNALTLWAYIYFAIVSIAIGGAAAVFTVGDIPNIRPPAPKKGTLPTKDDAA